MRDTIESQDWKVNVGKLEAHYKMHGDFNVAFRKDKDRHLSRWIENIRKYPGKLPVEVRNELIRIGFDFKVSSDWDAVFYKLEAFYQKHGHTNIPPGQKQYELLFDWIINQRRAKSLLTTAQIEKLNGLGFDWSLQNDRDLRWEEKYQQLISFRKEHGHTKVTYGFKENPALGMWVSAQRYNRTQNKLPQERIEKLSAVGFLWKEDVAKMKYDAWEKRYSELLDYQKMHGHIDRLQILKDHYQLGLWVGSQLARQDRISPDRKQKLDQVGLQWEKGDIYEERWQQMYERLRVYKQQHGHCRVKQHEDFKLSVWVHKNKQDKERLSIEKREKLGQLGFKWPNELFAEIWESSYQRLKTFKEVNGHLNVPRSDKKLYEWIQEQKKIKQDNRLNKEREDKLMSIAFIWKGDVQKQKRREWEMMYEKFKIFKKKHGDRYHIALKKDPELHEWVRLLVHSKDKLSAFKKQKLDAIDFLWSRGGNYKDELWGKMYEELVVFRDKHGHCDVSVKYPENRRLASWVKGQRTKQISGDKRDKLSTIGFCWAGQIQEQRWQQRLKAYSDLKAGNGLMTLRAHTPLHSWLYQQRKNFHRLTDEKRKLLLEVGIVKNEKDK